MPFSLPTERRKRMLRLMVVKRLCLSLVLVPLLAACADAGGADAATAVPASASPAPDATPAQHVPSRTGPLRDGGAAASCVETYSVTTIGNRDFAFDGTVVSVGPGGTNKASKGELDTAAVTFRVNEWFTGGTEDTVTVDMGAPTISVEQDQEPAYEEGTRMLVSGEPRWGGRPLEDPIAWSCGGFTRYYESAVADEWRRGTE